MDSVDIAEFVCEEQGSYERSMGPESLYELTHEMNCSQCGNEITLKFSVSEYPLGAQGPTIPDVKGADIEGRPHFEYLPDEYYQIAQFDVAKATIVEILHEIIWDEDILRQISPRQFEEVVAELFRKKGYSVELTPRIKDGGKDVIAVQTDVMGINCKYFIECKHYDEGNKISVDLVRSLHGVKNTKNGPNKTIMVTTSSFTRDARKFVEEEASSQWDMALIDFEKLLAWIREYDRSE